MICASWSKQRFFQIICIQIRSNMNETSQAVGRYCCSQLFGYKGRSEKLIEEDNITALKFDHSGRYLALGDKAGRLIIFQNNSQLQQEQEYDYYHEFQAHEPEYDKLKHLMLGENVTHIDWLRPQGKYLRMITASSHTVKLWRLYQRSERRMVKGSGQDLAMPHFQEEEASLTVNLKKSFPNQSFSPINSMALSSNEEYIFTADDRAIFLWNLEKNSRPFLQRQLKGGSETRLQRSQKITCARMHTQRESLQVWGTNKGRLSVADSRTSFTNPTVMEFNCVRDRSNFLSEIINQYSSVLFLDNQHSIATRDLISVKIWDMRSTREPTLNIYIDEGIKQHVCDLFEAEVLQDRFDLTEVKGNLLTGNYGNSFEMMDPTSGANVQYELDYGQETRVRRVGASERMNPFSCDTKVLNHDFNAATGQLAVSTRNCFFIFSEEGATSN